MNVIRRKDLTGQIFDRLTIISFNRTDKQYRTYWNCLCTCGKQTEVRTDQLTRGIAKSCGCLQKETVSIVNRTHGLTTSKSSALEKRTSNIYHGMMHRCYDPNQTGYENYGGRGIKVCDRWHNIDNFITDMGICPEDFTIERIDVNADYSKENCIWLHYSKQAANRRNTIHILINGKDYSLMDACREFNIAPTTARRKLSEGATPEKIFLNT